MGRRRQTDEIAFGSDSFLDIVANIVGILIILIVIAGIRVAQTPAVPAPITGSAPTTAEDPPPVPAEPIRFPKTIAAPPELMERLRSLGSELSHLEQIRAGLAREIAQKQQQTRTTQAELIASHSESQRVKQQILAGQRTVAALQTELETSQRQIAGLQLELAELKADRPPPVPLRFKLTPIGREPSGNGLFFLLANNRVAVIPYEQLQKKALPTFVASRSLMLHGKTIRRTFGPINGFTLEFESRLTSRAHRESWRSSAAADDTQPDVRCTFRESAETPFESFDAAMAPHSRFLAECRRDASAQTLVFFVRPDSYAIYQSLKNFGYDNGFYVAAHLIKKGEPVSESSTGSPLIAQ